MGHDGPYIQLRPPGGGTEWDCRPEDARLSTEAERRAACLPAADAGRAEALRHEAQQIGDGLFRCPRCEWTTTRK